MSMNQQSAGAAEAGSPAVLAQSGHRVGRGGGSVEVVYLNSRGGAGPAALTGGQAPGVRSLCVYELEAMPDTAWDSVDAMLVPAHVDQRFLMTQGERLERWLLAGGTMVLNGHVAYPFLSWLQPFEAQPCPGLEGLQVHRAAPHAIFDGVDVDHLTFRRGVAGFYARGGNPAPPQALVLNTLGPGRQPVDWLLALPGGGRLLVHSGNDLWMYANGLDTAARVLPQLLAWLEQGGEA